MSIKWKKDCEVSAAALIETLQEVPENTSSRNKTAFARRANGLFGFNCTIFFRRYNACGVKSGNLLMLNTVGDLYGLATDQIAQTALSSHLQVIY